MASKFYIKLDHNWQQDAKVRRFRKEAGKAGHQFE